jgi:hypothetical protein
MRDRCYRKKNKFFHLYGGRGIAVCEEWRKDYSAFRDWALENGYKKGLSVERKNNDLGYSPDNCTWATSLEQMRNRSNSLKLIHNDETKTAMEWSRVVGISYATIYQRIKRGWSAKDALTIKSDRTNHVMSLSSCND